MDKNMLPKLEKQTLVNDFINHFEEMIISGRLAVGEKLPSERDLAAQMGVSRPVVHEGLIDLAKKGLVTRPNSGGAIINDYRKDGSLVLLESLLRYKNGEIEIKLAESTLEFRMLVEVEFARLAALNRNEQHLQEMKSILEAEKECDLNKTEEIAELDFRLHHLIALATGNIFYPLLLNSFKELYFNGTMLFFTDKDLTNEVFDFHKRLFNAINGQDEQAAAEIMYSMLEHGKMNYRKLVRKDKS